MSKEIYYRADFKRYEQPHHNPLHSFKNSFRLTYYTTGKTAFVASFSAGKYTNCELQDDGSLAVTFKDHTLDAGQLLCRKEFFLSDADFSAGNSAATFTVPTDTFLVFDNTATCGCGGESTAETSSCFDYSDPVEGSELLMSFKMEPLDDVHLADCEFSVQYYTTTISKCHTITKADMKQKSEDEYLALVHTDLTGAGTLRYLATIEIPNEDATGGKLKLLKDVATSVNIRPMPE